MQEENKTQSGSQDCAKVPKAVNTTESISAVSGLKLNIGKSKQFGLKDTNVIEISLKVFLERMNSTINVGNKNLYVRL